MADDDDVHIPDEYIMMERENLLDEINSHVHKLTDTFSFILTYRELFRGTGLEFAQLSEYTPGEDDASRIDWKASLRSDNIYVKEYEEERDLNIIVLLDVGSSMLFGTKDLLKNEFGGMIAGSILKAGVDIGDSVAFGVFSDEMVKFFPPSNEEAQYYRAVDLLDDVGIYGGPSDLNEALRFIINNVGSNSYLFIVSDFIGLEEGWEDSLKMVSGKLQNVVGVMVRDIRDEELPAGSGKFRLQDPVSGNVMVIDLGKAKGTFEDLAQQQVEEVRNSFREADVGLLKTYTHESFVKKLVREMELQKEF